MGKSSITRRSYYKIAKLSLFYSLLLIAIVVATSFHYLKSNKLKVIHDTILLTTHRISDSILNQNFHLILRDIQQKTALQEVAIYGANCQLKAATALLEKELCSENLNNFESIETKINSIPVIIFYKHNYPLSTFLRDNFFHFTLLYLLFCFATSIILYTFLSNAFLKPIHLLQTQLGNPNISAIPSEFDFIGQKLHDLKIEIAKYEKDKIYFNLARQVVHDIRNPIAYLSIMSRLKTLDISSLDTKIEEIEYQINNLLNPKKSKDSLINIPSFIADLTNDVSKLFKVETKLKISNKINNNIILPLTKYDLKNILINLAKNSSEAGADSFTLDITPNDSGLEFQISDNGLGISEEFSTKIFEQNFTTKNIGNGIGLHSIRKLLEEEGGTINIDSSFKSGARFIFTIPFFNKPNVYALIDDDKFIRQAWKMAAEKSNDRLFTFASIEDFIAGHTDIPFEASIYIDSDLGAEKGEVDSEKIFKLGFTTLFLATSYDDLDLGSFPWLKALSSKIPPF